MQQFDLWIYAARVIEAGLHVEVYMREQVRLIEQHQLCRAEHVRVFQRFVLSFSHGQDHDFGCLAKIEQRRAYEIADVLYH